MESKQVSKFRELERENALLRQALLQATRIQAQGQEAIRRLKGTQSDLRKALLDAKQANQARGRFLANMSHELRTPLNGIIGMTELLLDGELSPEQAEFASTAKNSGEGLAALINDILDFSKIESGKLTVESIAFELRKEVDAVAAILAFSAQSKGVELVAVVESEVPQKVLGDPLRVRQVLLNLMNNAVKFTSKGEVEIRVARHDVEHPEWIQFAVRDTGNGISPDRLDAIFESFTQENQSTTRQFGGNGLGLTICKSLCGLMGGELQVESELGVGSEFCFRLPLPEATGLSAEPTSKRDSQSRRNDTHTDLARVAKEHPFVLIVDDNQASLDALAYHLRENSFEPICVQEPSQSIDLLVAQKSKIAAVLLDCTMPGVDSLALAKKMREAIAPREDMPILLLTSVTVPSHCAVEETEVTAYLPKPVNESRLLQGLATALFGEGMPEKSRQSFSTLSVLSQVPMQGKRVLVVDDNCVNQRVATKMLEKVGIQVDVANNGQEALDAIAQNTYSLVLMDCQMPVLNGFEATEEIRRLEHACSEPRHLPIIAMTAAAMKEDQDSCFRAGMDAYLSKPFQPIALFEMVARFMSKAAD